jgi:hypothetical protein
MWPDQRKDKSVSIEAPFAANDFKRRGLSNFAPWAWLDDVASRATQLGEPLASFSIAAKRRGGCHGQSETARRRLVKMIHNRLREIRACSNFLSSGGQFHCRRTSMCLRLLAADIADCAKKLGAAPGYHLAGKCIRSCPKDAGDQ